MKAGLILLFYFSLPAWAGSENWKEVQSEKWISIPLKTWKKPQRSCLLFASYWIVTEDRQNYVGMDVFVFKRKPTNKFPEDCNSDWKRAWAEFLDNEYGDVAIANDYLFLDLGTGHSRGMEIVFLGDKKQVAQFGFQAAGEFSIQADELTYRGHLGTWRDPKWEVIKECVWQPDQSRDLNQEDYTGILRVNLKTGAKKVSSVSCTVGPAAG